MIPLFTKGTDAAANVSFPPQWAYVKQGLLANVEQAVNYYRDWAKPYTPVDILMRLLYSIAVPMDLPLERFYRYIDDKALEVAMTLGMTSSLYKGKAHRGQFFSKDCTEFYIATDDFFDYELAHSKWREVRAINYLLHPKSDLDLVLPGNPAKYSEESGLVILTINVSMLAVQYRAFCLSEVGNPDGGRSVQQFIEQFVLPNMLYSQTEQAWFNRIYRKLFDINDANNVVVGRHPFQQLDWTTRADRAIAHIVENYELVDPFFDKLLKNTPALYDVSAAQSLILPDIAPTAQVEWLLVASRMKAFNFLLKACRNKPITANQGEISQLLRAFRSSGVGNMLDNNLSASASTEIQQYVDNLAQAANRAVY
jgi:hypothetical protein